MIHATVDAFWNVLMPYNVAIIRLINAKPPMNNHSFLQSSCFEINLGIPYHN
jgi:hypothetical protein